MPTLHLPISFGIPGDIVDDNTDFIKVEISNPSSVNINKVSINSMSSAVGTPTIEVRNASGGGGNAITVSFSDSQYFAENTGTLSVTDYIWIRSGNVSGGDLSNLNGFIRFNYIG